MELIVKHAREDRKAVVFRLDAEEMQSWFNGGRDGVRIRAAQLVNEKAPAARFAWIVSSNDRFLGIVDCVFQLEYVVPRRRYVRRDGVRRSP